MRAITYYKDTTSILKLAFNTRLTFMLVIFYKIYNCLNLHLFPKLITLQETAATSAAPLPLPSSDNISLNWKKQNN